MERFLSNNQDLQNIDFLNFDSNRIFFRKPKINKARSTRLDFDVNLEHIRFDSQTSKLQFAISFRKTISVNVYFFRRIEKDGQFGVFEHQPKSHSAKHRLKRFFTKFGLCFRPDIEDQLIRTKKKRLESEEPKDSPANPLISEVDADDNSVKQRRPRTLSERSIKKPEANVFKQDAATENIQETKSEHLSKSEFFGKDSGKNMQPGVDYSVRYSKIISPSEDKKHRLFEMSLQPSFFARLASFSKSSSYCPLVLEVEAFSSKPDKPRPRMYVLFEESQGRLVPLMKLFRNKSNRVFVLENIYDLSHEKSDCVFRGSPVSLKRADFREDLPNSSRFLNSGKKLKLKRKKTHKRSFCSICISARVTTILLPCRHLCVCYACSKDLINETNKCPICRHKISNLVRIYDC